MPAGDLVAISADPHDPIAVLCFRPITGMVLAKASLIQSRRDRERAVVSLAVADLEGAPGWVCLGKPIHARPVAIRRRSLASRCCRIDGRGRDGYGDIARQAGRLVVLGHD